MKCFNLAEEKLNCIEKLVLKLKFVHLCHIIVQDEGLLA